MIDPDTGKIRFDDGLELGPSTSAGKIVCPLGSAWSDQEGVHWQWLSLPDPHHWCSREFVVSVYFRNQVMWCVQLAIIGVEDRSSWKTWSKQQELKRKDAHDEVLKLCLPTGERTFSWGSVWSEFDESGGFSSIGINYGWKSVQARGRAMTR